MCCVCHIYNIDIARYARSERMYHSDVIGKTSPVSCTIQQIRQQFHVSIWYVFQVEQTSPLTVL